MLISAGYLAYDAVTLLLIVRRATTAPYSPRHIPLMSVLAAYPGRRSAQAGLRADRYLLAHHAIVVAGVAFGVVFGVGELHMATISLNEASSPCLHAR